MSPTDLHDDDAVTANTAAVERARRAEPDGVCAAAVELARAAATEDAEPGTVGEHLGVAAEGERLVMHSFACLSRGYRGWRWAVTVARAPRSRTATVCEVVLLPGDDSVLPPVWVPWSDRLAPGDLGTGDELPYRADDPLLEQGYEATGDEESDEFAIWQLGLGRRRVLSRLGREEAAERWYAGDRGPTADIAVHAAASCSSCGYLMPLAGSMRQAFGVCANEWSPSDGSVVSLDHGCGAHSETDVPPIEAEPLPVPILDESRIEEVVLLPKPAELDTVEVESSPEEEAQEPGADQDPEAVAAAVAVAVGVALDALATGPAPESEPVLDAPDEAAPDEAALDAAASDEAASDEAEPERAVAEALAAEPAVDDVVPEADEVPPPAGA